MKRISLVFCLVLASITGYAQSPTPQLSEIEKLKLQNLALLYKDDATAIAQLQAQEATLRIQYTALVVEVEKAHPGFTVDPSGNTEPVLIAKPKAEVKK